MPKLLKKNSSSTMEIVEFGKQLVETEDLDPVYVMLHNAGLSGQKLHKWLLAYWCFYHCGTASWIIDRIDYWNAMEQAAGSKDYPRSAERRHFRGQFAVKAVHWLEEQSIEKLFDFAIVGDKIPLGIAMDRVKEWYGFGDWIAFKVADMLNCLSICKVDFSNVEPYLFDAPRKGAEIAFTRYAPDSAIGTMDPVPWTLNYLQNNLGHMLAPPTYSRVLGNAEYESVCCKWKSHLNGHYTVGKDIHEVREGLLRFSTCRTSQLLLRNLPPCVM